MSFVPHPPSLRRTLLRRSAGEKVSRPTERDGTNEVEQPAANGSNSRAASQIAMPMLWKGGARSPQRAASTVRRADTPAGDGFARHSFERRRKCQPCLLGSRSWPQPTSEPLRDPPPGRRTQSRAEDSNSGPAFSPALRRRFGTFPTLGWPGTRGEATAPHYPIAAKQTDLTKNLSKKSPHRKSPRFRPPKAAVAPSEPPPTPRLRPAGCKVQPAISGLGDGRAENAGDLNRGLNYATWGCHGEDRPEARPEVVRTESMEGPRVTDRAGRNNTRG